MESAVTLVAYKYQYSGHPMALLFDPVSSRAYGQDFVNDAIVSQSDSTAGFRALGTFGNAVQLAVYLEFLIPLVFTYFLIERQLVRRLAYGVLLLLGLTAFAVTFSRAASLSLTFGLLVSLGLMYRRKLLTRKTWVALGYSAVMLDRKSVV